METLWQYWVIAESCLSTTSWCRLRGFSQSTPRAAMRTFYQLMCNHFLTLSKQSCTFRHCIGYFLNID